MSTVVSETMTAMEELKMREKPTSRLVRTSSLEKIKEFNNYICSQNYIILPALLNWLKSSQPGLETNLDVATAFYRHLLYNILLYKVIEFKIVCKGCIRKSRKLFNAQFKRLANGTASRIKDTDFLFKSAVYVVVVIVNLEITTCFYLLLANSAPLGLLFLTVCCLWSVVFLFYESIAHFEEQRRKWSTKIKTKAN
ncbi:uncharacterized protein LOC123320489 [Coccinella septempunctata]|uniref:uncharacterized protein LOC123320489 n=1 Tax=Coccinella septempunctata TaxID=41139 RepID=UPI001D087E34|nr:uncharacterized protein LOC123320489 [Coccinella septempunctata]